MMSYAGIDLPIVTPALASWVEKTIPPGDLFEFDPTLSLDAMGCLPVPQSLSLPPVRVGRLTWPTGVSRWATFYTVLTGEQLKALRLALIPDPGVNLGGYPAAPLILDDNKTTLTVQMTLLPPRPLSGYSSAFVEYTGDGTDAYGEIFQDDETHGELNDLYLVTLVDARYFWWFRQITTNLPTGDWSLLVEALLEALGFTINPADPEWADLDLGYPSPGPRWQNIKLLPIPLLIDAAATSTGRRAIRKMDTGAVAFQRWDEARTQAQALYARQYTETGELEEYDLTTIDFARVAGGSFPAEELRRTVPASVRVTTSDDFSDQEVVTLASLSLGAYKSITGRANEQAIIKLSNGDLLTVAIAERAAVDWYGWQLSNHDITLAGIAAWDACAWQEGVVWDHGADKIVTRVYRPPFPLGAAKGTCGGGGGGGNDSGFWAALVGKTHGSSCPSYEFKRANTTDGTTWTLDSTIEDPAYEVNCVDLPVLNSATDPIVVRMYPGDDGETFFLFEMTARWEFVRPVGGLSGGFFPGKTIKFTTGNAAVDDEDIQILDLN